jgi:hypothetical protein
MCISTPLTERHIVFQIYIMPAAKCKCLSVTTQVYTVRCVCAVFIKNGGITVYFVGMFGFAATYNTFHRITSIHKYMFIILISKILPPRLSVRGRVCSNANIQAELCWDQFPHGCPRLCRRHRTDSAARIHGIFRWCPPCSF